VASLTTPGSSSFATSPPNVDLVDMTALWSPLTNVIALRFIRHSRLERLFWISTCVAMAVCIVITVGPGYPDGTWIISAESLVHTIGVGYAARFIDGLQRVSANVDAAAECSAHEGFIASRMKAVAAESAEIARVIHDSAVNTLAAVASGRLGSSLGTIRARCRQDVTTLSELLRSERGKGWTAGTDPWETAVAEGVTLVTPELSKKTFQAHLASLPEPVARTVTAAIGEAVRNTAKHAQCNQAELSITRTVEDMTFVVCDNGVGFDGQILDGRGIQRSIVEHCKQAGVRATVTSAPGAGTRVQLTVPISDPTDEQHEARNVAPDPEQKAFLTEAVWTINRIAPAVILICISSTFIGARGRPEPYAVVTLAMLTMTYLFASRRYRHSPRLPTWFAWVIVAQIPIIVTTSDLQQPKCGPATTSVWTSSGCVPLVVMLILLYRRAWAIVAAGAAGIGAYIAVVSLSAQPPCGRHAPTYALISVVFLLCVWAYRQQLWALTSLAHQRQSEANAYRQQAIEAEATQRLRRSRRSYVLTSSARLLTAIADGDMSPYDDAVRQRCRAEESYLRELTTLGLERTELGECLARSLAMAHSRGITLKILAVADQAPEQVTDQIETMLAAAITGAEAGATISFRVSGKGEATRINFVGPISSMEKAGRVFKPADHQHARGDWMMRYVEFDDEALIELGQM